MEILANLVLYHDPSGQYVRRLLAPVPPIMALAISARVFPGFNFCSARFNVSMQRTKASRIFGVGYPSENMRIV